MLIRHLVIDLKNDQTFTTFANKRRAYLAPRYACSIKCPQVNNAYVGNLITANNNIHHTGVLQYQYQCRFLLEVCFGYRSANLYIGNA